MPWKSTPINITHWSKDVTHTLFIDESGCPDMKTIQKKIHAHLPIPDNDRFFTTTACLVNIKDYPTLMNDFINIKHNHWPNGKFKYKDGKKGVCFHSSEIRAQKGPFSNNVIDRTQFMDDLTHLMDKSNYAVLSTTIDKVAHYNKYNTPHYPYSVSLELILERLVKFILTPADSCNILIESRGHKENTVLLKAITHFIEHGTRYVDKSYFSKIKGVYFNGKWCSNSKNQKTHIGLELADLASYPIYRYVIDRRNITSKNRAMTIIMKKIYKNQGQLHGLKIFP